MKLLAAILLCLAIQPVALAQRDAFAVSYLGGSVETKTDKCDAFAVRYLGGSVETKTDKDEWANKLIIVADEIRLELKDGQKVSIDPHAVTSISYGREATRHVARWVALGVLFAPIAVIGIFNQNVQHYVSIEYETADHKKGAVLIQAHKDNYRNVLAMLRGATGKEIETEKKKKR